MSNYLAQNEETKGSVVQANNGLYKYAFVNDRNSVKELIANLNITQDFIALDIETTGLNRFKDSIECFVISTNVGLDGEAAAAYIPAEFIDELLNIQVPLVLHNFKFDFLFLLQNGVDLRKLGVAVIDTMLIHHLLDENTDHSLDYLIQTTFKDPYKEVFWGKYKTYQEASFSDKLEYACKDVIYTAKLFLDMQSKLTMSGLPTSLVEEVHAFALASYDTEAAGLKIDLAYLEDLGVKNRKIAVDLLSSMNALCAREVDAIETEAWVAELDKRKTAQGKANVKRPVFSWSSNQQLQKLIYGQLGLKEVRKKSKTTKKVRPVLDDEALEVLKDEHPVISMLQSYRANEKTYGSFIEGVLDKQHGGRVYPSININGTIGHRTSCSGPNLQQMPATGGIRGMFAADEGHKLISADYASLEVVMAAHFSHDKNLLSIIYDGASKHDITAQALKLDRKIAKTLNFAMQYLCSPRKVAEVVGCSLKEAEGIHAQYWNTYSGEKAVIDRCKASIDAGLGIVDISGRRRRFPATFEALWQKEAAYRQGYNFLLQSSGAYCTNKAFTNMHYYLNVTSRGNTIIVVHDELLVQAKDEFTGEVEDALVEHMEAVAEEVGLTVPLKAVGSGPMERWED